MSDEVAYFVRVVVGAEVGLDVERDMGKEVGVNVVVLFIGG